MISSNRMHSDTGHTLLRTIVFTWVLILFAWTQAGAAAVRLDALDNRCNYFSGQDYAAKYRLSANDIFRGKVLWRLAFQGRTIQRGEQSVTIRDANLIIGIDLRLPETKSDVVLPVDLELRVQSYHSEQPVLQTTEKKWIFSRRLFAERREELRRLDIHLFDPARSSAKIFNAAGIPFTPVYRLETMGELKHAFLIIGEGISLNTYRGLADMMIEAASAGNRVLCLKPRQGSIPHPAILPADGVGASSVHLNDNNIIRFLDKRLDMAAWSPEGRIAVCGFNPQGVKNRIMGDIACNDKGWPWFALDFDKTGGKFLLCGFGIIEAWDCEPAPRYLLDRIFQYLHNKQ